MKRILVFLITAGAALIISNQTKAQGYYTTTTYAYSYNNYNDWDLPVYVRNVVVNHYHGSGIVNARSYYVNGHLAFNLFLNTGNTFVEVEVDRYGHITRSVGYHSIPNHHVWVYNHSDYYRPKHHHGHHGHHKHHGHHGHHKHHGHNGHHKKHNHGHHNGHAHNKHVNNTYYVDYPSTKHHHKANKHSENKHHEKMHGNSNANRGGNYKARTRQVKNTRGGNSNRQYAYNGRH